MTTLNSIAKETQVIRISKAAYEHPSLELIHTIFKATVEEYGDYQFKAMGDVPQGRAIAELSHSRLIDLIWFSTNKEREQKLLPIRIPLTMGLMGYRVCLINKGDQNKFKGISDLHSWQQSRLAIGQASHWPDTKILLKNDMLVTQGYWYTALFDMLRKKRFDCFARSVFEINKELAFSPDLVAEENLLFYYPMPEFIFVRKDNQALAERLSKGLAVIRKNGQFVEYLKKAKLNALKGLNLNKRHVIRLENPLLTTETKKLLEDDSFWFEL